MGSLDPAAEAFKYSCSFDIRDLVSVSDVMSELALGPNGALVYCMEYLVENSHWLSDQLGAVAGGPLGGGQRAVGWSERRVGASARSRLA